VNPVVRQDLFDRLEALGVALDAGELDTAAQRMTDYDVALRRYIETTGPDAPLDVLRDLLSIQNALLLRMRERQAVIGAALRQAHRQDSASRAYANVEVAP
jgi:hypothetical protein